MSQPPMTSILPAASPQAPAASPQAPAASPQAPAAQHGTPFLSAAPAFFARGMSVIPLRKAEKIPTSLSWSTWATNPIDPETQRLWLQQYTDHNIGIAAGPQSRCVFIDLDSLDADVARVLSEVLPESMWKRIGAKGFVAAYRWTPDAPKNFKIYSAEGKTLVEFMNIGNQIVLPPSIHPDTQRPYTSNCNLYDVVDYLTPVPHDLEQRLRSGFLRNHIRLRVTGHSRLTDVVPKGARDNRMVSLAGMCTSDILKGRLSLQEAFDRMDAWFKTLVDNSDSETDVQKGKEKIVEFLERDMKKFNQMLPLGWDKGLDPAAQEKIAATFGQEKIEWAYGQLVSFITGELDMREIDDPRRMELLEETLRRISCSISLTSIEIEGLLAHLSSVIGIRGATSAVLRKRLKEIKQNGIAGANHTEIAVAVRSEISRYGDVTYHQGNFYQWGGSHWEHLLDSEIMYRIASDFGSLDAAKRLSDHKGIFAVLGTLCRREMKVARGVNFANGFLDARGELHPHLPEFDINYVLPYNYRPELAGKCPKFLGFLQSVWGKDLDFKQKVDCLQEILAIAMMGRGTDMQQAYLFYGVAGSGKSTLLEIIRSLFPSDAVSSVTPGHWGDRFNTELMVGKTVNMAGELDEHTPINGRLFKEVIDGSPMLLQKKFGDPYNARITASHFFGSNHLPKSDDTSAGFIRRWKMLEFKRAIPPQEQVIDLVAEIVCDEREAIAAWGLEALDRVQSKKTLTEPVSHKRLIRLLGAQNNPARFFFYECPRIRSWASFGDVPQAWDEYLRGTAIDYKQTPDVSKKDALRMTPELFKGIAAGAMVSDQHLWSLCYGFLAQQNMLRGMNLQKFKVALSQLEQEIGFIAHDRGEITFYQGLVAVSQ
jgi:putative DNA primase/helicase